MRHIRARLHHVVALRRRMRRRSTLGWLLLLVAATSWFVLLRPASLGGPAAYIVVTGVSMQPTLYEGDLALLRRQDTYEAGDIVAFKVGGGKVIHRIIDGSAAEGYTLQGDNRASADYWHPTPDDIAGRMWLRVPRGGHALIWLRQPTHIAPLAGGLAFLAAYGTGRNGVPRCAAKSRT